MFIKNKFALVDIFAGAGGLSEGFLQRKNLCSAHLSIEKDPIACRTLKIRKIYHLIQSNGIEDLDYIDLLKNQSKFDQFVTNNKSIKNILDNSVWNFELGSEDSNKTAETIKKKLSNQGWNSKKGDQIILIGGPPCQAYSIAGRSRRSKMIQTGKYKPEKDERNFLYEKYLDLIEKLNPVMFLMENVPGILSAKVNEELVFSKILKDLSYPSLKIEEKNSYELFPLKKKDDLFNKNSDFSINSEDYGIPQSRKRVIIFGIRKDLEVREIPYLEEKEKITIKDVLIDLPVLRSGISKIDNKSVKDSETEWKRALINWSLEEKKALTLDQADFLLKIISEIDKHPFLEGRGGDLLKKHKRVVNKKLAPDLLDWIMDDSLKYHLNLTTRAHMAGDLKRYLFNSIFTALNNKSPLLSDYPDSLLPNHKSRTKGYQDRFRTLVLDRPSKTITSHISKDGHAFIHPDPLQCRSLTVREAARIQTFPDNYFFSGNRTQQYAQVGNAVPPYLAYLISGIVEKISNTYAANKSV